MKAAIKAPRVVVPAAPVHSTVPNERMNRIGFYFFMSMVALGVLVAFGALLFI
ncbi:MAG: hypothetical protein O3C45_06035 [Bacteroidetes bacterium]|nr:hypothetical protein [Bacteroidota bacterium]MDA0874608.1 hypothetical protein [Bacteroidota bacterium]